MKNKPCFAAIVLIPVLLLTACTSKDQDDQPPAAEKRSQQFNEANAPLEQAKGVEQQMQQSAEEQRQKIDRETGE